MSKEIDLKDCPFCGSKAAFHKLPAYGWRVYCTGELCPVEMQTRFVHHQEGAAKYWNTRTLTQKIVFSFDDKSYESLDKMIKQGRYPDSKSNNPDDYEEIPVTNPETKETRIIVLPKENR